MRGEIVGFEYDPECTSCEGTGVVELLVDGYSWYHCDEMNLHKVAIKTLCGDCATVVYPERGRERSARR
jgi:hypothetical protein